MWCSVAIREPTRGVVVVVLEGDDVGEFGDRPMDDVAERIGSSGPIELFLDARDANLASIDVTGRWAQWLRAHRSDLEHVSLLTRSRFLSLSADVVHRFAELGEAMRIYTHAPDFDEALNRAVTSRRAT